MQQTTTEAGNVQVVTDATFDAVVLQAKELVLVDFGAPWCPPCRMMEPIVRSLADEFSGRLVVASMDVDDNTDTAQRYNITSLPTFMLFANGQPVDTMIGAVPRPVLEARISEHLPG